MQKLPTVKMYASVPIFVFCVFMPLLNNVETFSAECSDKTIALIDASLNERLLHAMLSLTYTMLPFCLQNVMSKRKAIDIYM